MKKLNIIKKFLGGMSLDLVPRIELKHELRRYISNCFPTAEKLLNQKKYQSAVEYVGDKNRMNKYRTVMDYLFCELNPEWQKSCFNYYKNKGSQLIKQVQEPQLKIWDMELVVALELAKSLLDKKRKESWGWYKNMYTHLTEGKT